MAEKVARLDKEQWDTLKAVLDGEIADLRDRLRQAQEKLEEKRQDLVHAEARLESVILQRERERDAAIDQNKRIMAWVCQFIEKHGTVVFTGLSVPKRKLDEAQAEHARRCDDLVKRAEAAEALAETRLNCGLAALDILRAVLEAGHTTVTVGDHEWKGWGTARVLAPAEAQERQKEER